MADRSKPQVDVPSDQPPSYQLEVEDIEVGDGKEAAAGNIAEVHYVGVSWKTGRQFDASWDRGKTFQFALGKGQVIAGWDTDPARPSRACESEAGDGSPSRRCSPTASTAPAGSSARTRPWSSSST